MRLPKTLLILVFVAVIVLSIVYGNNPAVENFANVSAGGIVAIIAVVIIIIVVLAMFASAGLGTEGSFMIGNMLR